MEMIASLCKCRNSESRNLSDGELETHNNRARGLRLRTENVFSCFLADGFFRCRQHPSVLHIGNADPGVLAAVPIRRVVSPAEFFPRKTRRCRQAEPNATNSEPRTAHCHHWSRPPNVRFSGLGTSLTASARHKSASAVQGRVRSSESCGTNRPRTARSRTKPRIDLTDLARVGNLIVKFKQPTSVQRLSASDNIAFN